MHVIFFMILPPATFCCHSLEQDLVNGDWIIWKYAIWWFQKYVTGWLKRPSKFLVNSELKKSLTKCLDQNMLRNCLKNRVAELFCRCVVLFPHIHVFTGICMDRTNSAPGTQLMTWWNGHGPKLLWIETKWLFDRKVLENKQMITRIVIESGYSLPAALFML